MEQVSAVRVIRAGFVWDDVGSWLSMPRLFEADAAENVVRGPHAGLATERCIVVSDDPGMLIATLGISDLAVVASGGAVLVAHRDALDRLKDLVARMEERGLDRWL
jgi:mannose-1-phosphate guanylyltransferase